MRNADEYFVFQFSLPASDCSVKLLLAIKSNRNLLDDFDNLAGFNLRRV
jgi:hypothetical protein